MRLVEVTPTPFERWAIVAIGILLLIGATAVGRYRPHRGNDELKPLLRNLARQGRRPWIVTDKTYCIHVPSQGGLRRDASLEVNVILQNRSRRMLGKIDFPIAGDSRVRAGDLTVVAEVDHRATHAEVRYVDGNSPIVAVPMPAPGLLPGKEIPIRLRWTWPGMANMRGGTWTFVMTNAQSASSTRIDLMYPIDCPQLAEVRLVRSFGGIHWDVPKGSLSAKSTPKGLLFEFDHTRRSLDSLVCIDMTAAPEILENADHDLASQWS